MCQKVQDSTRSGKTYTLCESCAAGRQTIESLQRELKKEREDSIYWQECYETALKELSECDYTLMNEVIMVPAEEFNQLSNYYQGKITESAILNKAGAIGRRTAIDFRR